MLLQERDILRDLSKTELLTDGMTRDLSLIAALRRRGFTPESIRMFIELCWSVKERRVLLDYAMLEYCIREDLRLKDARMMAVLDPDKACYYQLS